jgi:hypothetical protein
VKRLEDHLDRQQLDLLSGLTSPERIQALLDSIAYSAEDINRCPLRVLQDRTAHCYDGAFLAAAALRRIGYPPIVVDMMPEPRRDDDHLLAIFRRNGLFGALAKSNFVGLRYREPIYRNLRELVLSYFEDYFNVDGEKTLRVGRFDLLLKVKDRWVVLDYKTGQSEGDVETWVRNQKRRYGPQLGAYVQMMARMLSIPREGVQAAMLFTALPRLVWQEG